MGTKIKKTCLLYPDSLFRYFLTEAEASVEGKRVFTCRPLDLIDTRHSGSSGGDRRTGAEAVRFTSLAAENKMRKATS